MKFFFDKISIWLRIHLDFFFVWIYLMKKKDLTKKMLTPTFLDPNIFLTQTILDRNFVGPKFELNLNLECSTSSPACFCPALTKLALDLHVNFCVYVCISGLFFRGFHCLNDQAHFAWFTSGVAQGQLESKIWA